MKIPFIGMEGPGKAKLFGEKSTFTKRQRKMENADHNFWETTVPKIGEILAQYVNRSQKLETQVLQQQEPSQLIKDLNTEQLFRAGFKSQEEVLDFTQTYLKNTNHLHHPHYMGHQVAVPHPISGIPDWIHGTANNPFFFVRNGPCRRSFGRIYDPLDVGSTGVVQGN